MLSDFLENSQFIISKTLQVGYIKLITSQSLTVNEFDYFNKVGYSLTTHQHRSKNHFLYIFEK